MQALLVYDSEDSDDAEFNEVVQSTTTTAARESETNECISLPLEGLPNTSSAIDISLGTKVDFFGLNESESDGDDNGATSAKRQCAEQHPVNKIHVSGVEIELPQSKFWEHAIQETITSTDWPLPSYDNTDIAQTAEKKITHDSQFNEKSHLRKYQCSRNTPMSSLDFQHRLTEDRNEKRQIYCVHSKIAPYLHSVSGRRQNYKVPRSVIKSLVGHRGVVNRVKWCCPNFSHLLLSASMDSTVKVWNCWSHIDPCVRTLTCHSKAVKDAEWSPCGRQILSCSYDRTAVITDVETGKTERCFGASDYLTCGKFHPGNHSLIYVGTKNCVLCWDIRASNNPSQQFTHKDTFGQVQDVVISQDGSQLFACGDIVSRDSADRNIIAWDFTSAVVLSNQIFQERYTCTRLKLHPTEGHMLAQTHGNYIAIFSVKRPYKMNKYRRYEGHKLKGYSVGFDVSSDGSLVASGSGDGLLHFYHNQTCKRLQTLDTGWIVCMDVALHPVLFSTLACCNWEGQITLWQ